MPYDNNLMDFLLGKVQFSQEARCTSWPELITQAAVISRKAFNVKLGLRRPVGDRGANRGCVCLIYNSRASQPALANVYTPSSSKTEGRPTIFCHPTRGWKIKIHTVRFLEFFPQRILYFHEWFCHSHHTL